MHHMMSCPSKEDENDFVDEAHNDVDAVEVIEPETNCEEEATPCIADVVFNTQEITDVLSEEVALYNASILSSTHDDSSKVSAGTRTEDRDLITEYSLAWEDEVDTKSAGSIRSLLTSTTTTTNTDKSPEHYPSFFECNQERLRLNNEFGEEELGDLLTQHWWIRFLKETNDEVKDNKIKMKSLQDEKEHLTKKLQEMEIKVKIRDDMLERSKSDERKK